MRITRATGLAALIISATIAANAQQSPGPSHLHDPLQTPEGGSVLKLTAEEKHTILENVDSSRISTGTLGLGALTEGEPSPSNATLLKFDGIVTQKISKLSGHTYFLAENKVVVVDRQNRIAAVIEDVKK